MIQKIRERRETTNVGQRWRWWQYLRSLVSPLSSLGLVAPGGRGHHRHIAKHSLNHEGVVPGGGPHPRVDVARSVAADEIDTDGAALRSETADRRVAVGAHPTHHHGGS